jgi:hypothetical protein
MSKRPSLVLCPGTGHCNAKAYLAFDRGLFLPFVMTGGDPGVAWGGDVDIAAYTGGIRKRETQTQTILFTLKTLSDCQLRSLSPVQ